MTEEQAKKKRCPHLLGNTLISSMMAQIYAEPGTEKIQKIIDEGSSCIASDCMFGCDDDGKWLGHCGLAK